MADRKMLLGARRICEYLQANPGCTRQQVAEGINESYKNVRSTVTRLEQSGYVKRDGEYDAKLSLTGKPFPASADYQKVVRYVERLEREAKKSFKRTALDMAIYHMVRIGRTS